MRGSLTEYALQSAVKAALCNFLSALRLPLGYLLFGATARFDLFAAGVVLALVALSDILDGHLARYWRVESRFGAWLDVFADGAAILAALSALAYRGVVGWWLPVLVFMMLGQFVLTSSHRPIYDPVGKHYGAVLFAGLGGCIVLPDPAVGLTFQATVVLLSAATLVTRAFALTTTGGRERA